jgi:stress-induced morphogen
MVEQTDKATGDRIKAKLVAALAPAFIEVSDESRKHAGHGHALYTFSH